jgi:cobalt-zinc-cadmium efflux system outer membrane protein
MPPPSCKIFLSAQTPSRARALRSSGLLVATTTYPRNLGHPMIRRNELKTFGILYIIVLVAAPAGSQPSRPEAGAAQPQPKKLTLPAALDLATRQNLDVVAARQRRAVTQAGVQIAKQRPNPTVNFTALRDSPHEGLFLEQPLELGTKRQRRIELARQAAGLTEVEIAALGRQVRRRVREAFYAAAYARGASIQRAQALELVKRLREIAQARFEAGDVPQLEVFQADLETSRAEADLGVTQQREKVAFSQLNALLNEPPETPWELVGSLEDLPSPIPLTELISRAEESNPELQHLAQEQRVEQSRGTLLRAERIPNLNLQFGTDFNSPRDFRVGPRSQLSVMLPLFTRNQGEIAQSVASLRVLEGEAAAAKRAVAARVEAAHFELSARQAQAELYRRALLPTARRLKNLAEESYRAGKANFLTVLDAQRNVQQVERDYLESLFALQTAFAGLEETVGAPFD